MQASEIHEFPTKHMRRFWPDVTVHDALMHVLLMGHSSHLDCFEWHGFDSRSRAQDVLCTHDATTPRLCRHQVAEGTKEDIPLGMPCAFRSFSLYPNANNTQQSVLTNLIACDHVYCSVALQAPG